MQIKAINNGKNIVINFEDFISLLEDALSTNSNQPSNKLIKINNTINKFKELKKKEIDSLKKFTITKDINIF